MSQRRKLFSAPVLYTTWDEDQEEASTNWVELFGDLLYVYAASSCAEIIEEDMSWKNMVFFLIIAITFCSTWLRYTLYTIRFCDGSFSHDILVVLHLITVLGIAVNVHNAPSHHSVLVLWLALSRLTILVIYAVPFFVVPKMKPYLASYCISIFLSALLYFISGFVSFQVALGLWILVFLQENYFFFLTRFLPFHPRHLRIHVEYFGDRFGDLMMVTIGETIVSISANKIKDNDTYYYICFALSVTQCFFLALLYYHVNPNQHWHAVRRSAIHGVVWMSTHIGLFVSFLVHAAGIKYCLERAKFHEDLANFEVQTLVHGTVAIRLCVLVIRLTHYGFRKMNPKVLTMTRLWWIMIALFCFVPYLAFLLPFSPLALILFLSGSSILYGIIECSFTHIFDDIENSFFESALVEDGSMNSIVDIEHRETDPLLSDDDSEPELELPMDSEIIECERKHELRSQQSTGANIRRRHTEKTCRLNF